MLSLVTAITLISLVQSTWHQILNDKKPIWVAGLKQVDPLFRMVNQLCEHTEFLPVNLADNPQKNATQKKTLYYLNWKRFTHEQHQVWDLDKFLNPVDRGFQSGEKAVFEEKYFAVAYDPPQSDNMLVAMVEKENGTIQPHQLKEKVKQLFPQQFGIDKCQLEKIITPQKHEIPPGSANLNNHTWFILRSLPHQESSDSVNSTGVTGPKTNLCRGNPGNNGDCGIVSGAADMNWSIVIRVGAIGLLILVVMIFAVILFVSVRKREDLSDNDLVEEIDVAIDKSGPIVCQNCDGNGILFMNRNEPKICDVCLGLGEKN